MKSIYKEVISQDKHDYLTITKSLELVMVDENTTHVYEHIAVNMAQVPEGQYWKPKIQVDGADDDFKEMKTRALIAIFEDGEIKIATMRGIASIGKFRQWDTLWEPVFNMTFLKALYGECSRAIDRIKSFTLITTAIQSVFPHGAAVMAKDAIPYIFIRNIWKNYLQNQFIEAVNCYIDLRKDA